MVVDVGVVKNHIKPKADSTLCNMRKVDLIEYIRTLEHNYNVAVSFNENQAKYCEHLIHVDEDMALALAAGAAASEIVSRRVSLFEVGGDDQRTISFGQAAHALRRAGEKVLKSRGVCDG